MFNNMNRSGSSGGTSAENSPVSSGAGVEFRRKGNSLPRGTVPGVGSAAAGNAASARNPSGAKSNSESPSLLKKDVATDDDPRILKLDDEFDVEDV